MNPVLQSTTAAWPTDLWHVCYWTLQIVELHVHTMAHISTASHPLAILMDPKRISVLAAPATVEGSRAYNGLQKSLFWKPHDVYKGKAKWQILTYIHEIFIKTMAERTDITHNKKAQLSLTNPRDAKACQKLLQFDVLTTLSLTILAYLHAFSCCCVRNLRNPEKFTENSNLWSSRSSKIIDLGANRNPICDLLLVINSNFSRICYRFRDIHG